MERMDRVGQAYIRFALECPHQFHLLAFPPEGAPALDRVEALVREQVGKVASLIREGIAEGSLRPDIDADRTAMVVWRMFDGVLSLAHRPDGLRAGPHEMVTLLTIMGELLNAALQVSSDRAVR